MDAGTIAIATKMTRTLSVKRFPNDILTTLMQQISVTDLMQEKNSTNKIIPFLTV